MARNAIVTIRYPATSEAGTSHLDAAYLTVRESFIPWLREMLKYLPAPGTCKIAHAVQRRGIVAGVYVTSSTVFENNEIIRFLLGLYGTFMQEPEKMVVLPKAVRSVELGKPEVFVEW